MPCELGFRDVDVGHSVAVLWQLYAARLHDQDVIARKQVEEFFDYQA